MNITLDPGAAVLLERLHGAGFAAYAVGGCVRDSLLGRSPHDWDLCTSALPQQVMTLFGEERCIPTGLQHGTVTVKQGGELYEITTFRTEGSYTDGRHPDEVRFVPDVTEDLARRDFTINAMAYSPAEGLIDPFGGRQDLQQGLVRAVGVPEQRFEEDALRIMRLYRFAARYGFAIDPATAAAADALSGRLPCVSVERIEEELTKLLCAPAPGAYLAPQMMAVVLPELSAPALETACTQLDRCPAGEQGLTVRLAVLLASLGEAGARAVLKRLRCSNACVDQTSQLVREQALCPERDPASRRLQAKQLLGALGLEQLARLTALCTALRPEDAEILAALYEQAQALECAQVCCRVSQLAVNGRDLMAAGIPAGRGLRTVLETLLDEVMQETLPNVRTALLERAGEMTR